MRALDSSTNANFYPWLRLFGPTGVLLAADNDQTEALISYQATNSGSFTVLVGNATAGHTGNYRLTGNGLSDGLKLCTPGILTTNLTLSGVGGAANGTYVVLSATNVTSPLVSWVPIRTNQFDPFGVFTFTNLFDRAERARYFRLTAP